MAKTKVSIYLVKQGIARYEDIVKVDLCPYQEDIKNVGVFYSKQSRSSVPKWVNDVFGSALDSSNLSTSSVSAALLVPVEVADEESRIFALTFGFGRTLLIPSAIEERFGLKTVLNLASDDSIRKVKRTTLAGNALKAEEQLPRTSTIGDFGIDTERDLLEGVTASLPKDTPILMGNVTGSDALSASMEIDIGNMKDVLSAIYEFYSTDKYQTSFPWIDRIAAVKPQDEIDALNEYAVSKIRARSQDIWMAVPEVIKWEDVFGFRVVNDPEICLDIDIGRVVASLSDGLSSFDQLKRREIRVISSDGNTVVRSWPSSSCLFGELNYNGSHYCLNSGKWYRIDNDYAAGINAAYDRVPISSIDFPEWAADMKEGDYNKSLAKQDSDGEKTRALMDAHIIPYGNGASKIELCDVLFDDGTFVHVKKYSGSAVLSHLFNQGLVSAGLVKSDDQFLKKASQKLKQKNPGFPAELSHDCVKRVVFAIGTKTGETRPRIPFFSKLALYYVKWQLNMMGVPVEIKGVHYLGDR